MSSNKSIRALVLTFVLLTTNAFAQTPYDEGQNALRSQRWMEAAGLFEQAIEADVTSQDEIPAAMYWRAHALYKAGHKGDAARQVRQLERQYESSRWLNEARALQIEYQGSIEDAGEEDELRLFALSQLLERDFNRALPLVIEIMNNTESPSARQDALFLLGMSEHPEAQQAIADAVSDSDDPELQAHAISLLAMSGSEASLDLLEGLYTPDARKDVKQAVLHAYFNAERSSKLVAILKTETDPEMQRDIIHALGAMEATDDLVEIYASLNDVESRRAAIEAFAISGNTQKLKEILASETDPEMRMTAIQGIAINDDGESAELIRSLYDQAASVEEKRHLMEALLIMEDAEDLAVQIVKTETDPELLELAIHSLAFSGHTEALQGMYEQFAQTEIRETILQAMAMTGDTDGVRKVLETEQNAEIRVAAIHALAMADEEGTAEFLSGSYDGKSMEEKTAIIHSMMILEDAKGLIRLMNLEEDASLRREMLQMLTVMDSEEANEFLFEMLESKG
jgi:hypothetical protein